MATPPESTFKRMSYNIKKISSKMNIAAASLPHSPQNMDEGEFDPISSHSSFYLTSGDEASPKINNKHVDDELRFQVQAPTYQISLYNSPLTKSIESIQKTKRSVFPDDLQRKYTNVAFKFTSLEFPSKSETSENQFSNDIRNILIKQKFERTKLEVEKLLFVFRDLNFFKQVQSENGHDTLKNLMHVLKVEELRMGEKVFNCDDYGSKFYIILKGSVSIQIPQQKKITGNTKLSQSDKLLRFLEFAIENYDIIYWNKMPQTQLVQQILNENLSFKKKHVVGLNQSKPIQSKNKHKQQSIQISNQQQETLQHANFDLDNIWVMQEVNQLTEGQSFGEMALLNSKPRNATIECIENCFLATVEKQDYMEVLQKATKKKIQEKIKFLQSYRLFKNVTSIKLQKALYFIKDKKFVRNQVLFKEGDPIDGVYIIISGEYEYFKNVGDPDFDKTSSKWVEFAIKSNIKGDINNTSKRSIAIIQSGEIIGFEEIYENFYSQQIETIQGALEKKFFLQKYPKTGEMRMTDQEFYKTHSSIGSLKNHKSEGKRTLSCAVLTNDSTAYYISKDDFLSIIGSGGILGQVFDRIYKERKDFIMQRITACVKIKANEKQVAEQSLSEQIKHACLQNDKLSALNGSISTSVLLKTPGQFIKKQTKTQNTEKTVKEQERGTLIFKNHLFLKSLGQKIFGDNSDKISGKDYLKRETEKKFLKILKKIAEDPTLLNTSLPAQQNSSSKINPQQKSKLDEIQDELNLHLDTIDEIPKNKKDPITQLEIEQSKERMKRKLVSLTMLQEEKELRRKLKDRHDQEKLIMLGKQRTLDLFTLNQTLDMKVRALTPTRVSSMKTLNMSQNAKRLSIEQKGVGNNTQSNLKVQSMELSAQPSQRKSRFYSQSRALDTVQSYKNIPVQIRQGEQIIDISELKLPPKYPKNAPVKKKHKRIFSDASQMLQKAKIHKISKNHKVKTMIQFDNSQDQPSFHITTKEFSSPQLKSPVHRRMYGNIRSSKSSNEKRDEEEPEETVESQKQSPISTPPLQS